MQDTASPLTSSEIAGTFRSPLYVRLNARRLEHLASLPLELRGRSVLEVGAGIGDLTSFFVDRGCRVTASDARAENVAILSATLPGLETLTLDLDRPRGLDGRRFDIVFCYGVLYHLAEPARALAFLSARCSGQLLLETRVAFGADARLEDHDESRDWPTESFSGRGCKPTREWVFRELQRHFEHVYVPITQPCHPFFPLDWTEPPALPSEPSLRAPDDAPGGPTMFRSVFIASRTPLMAAQLRPELLSRQRHA
jgi:SAM-dependent methyltransferase